jgi:hypothetical protein
MGNFQAAERVVGFVAIEGIVTIAKNVASQKHGDEQGQKKNDPGRDPPGTYASI